MGRAGADASNDGSFAWHTKAVAKSRVSQFLASTPILTATPTAESLQHTLTNHAVTFIHPATTRRSSPARTPLCWTQLRWVASSRVVYESGLIIGTGVS